MGEKFYQIKLSNILFLDIETVPNVPNFYDLSPNMQELWDKKSKRLQGADQNAFEIYSQSGIFAEFGKIICISVGYIKQKNGINTLRIKSFANDDEVKLLSDFTELLTQHFNKPAHYLCAHNGKEFDFPYIARRLLINGMNIPDCLDTRGLKPWEVKHLDTLELWRFGDYKNYSSLKLLTEIFGIPTPKDDIDGAMVYDVYWNENNLNRIIDYCQKDVIAIVQLFQKYRGDTLIDNSNIIIL